VVMMLSPPKMAVVGTTGERDEMSNTYQEFIKIEFLVVVSTWPVSVSV
jgi:hypothetical protein